MKKDCFDLCDITDCPKYGHDVLPFAVCAADPVIDRYDQSAVVNTPCVTCVSRDNKISCGRCVHANSDNVSEQRDAVIPPFMIHQSFRYMLGRTSYAVSVWCEWAVENWEAIPAAERAIIARELDEAFARDDEFREESSWADLGKPLGHDCDRRSWAAVREMYRNG